MTRLFSFSNLSEQKLFQQRDRRIWLTVGILTIALHLLIFLIPWNDIVNPHRKSKPVVVKTISPEMLEKIRASQKNRKFLLSKNEDAPKDPTVKNNDKARYISDRTRHVETETRARITRVLPDPKTGHGQSDPSPVAQPNRSLKKPISNLSQFGVPLNYDQNTSPMKRRQQSDFFGADQALVNEDDLLDGAENLLNTQESIYYSYYSRLYREIAPIWESRIQSNSAGRKILDGQYVSIVELTFNSEGTLIGLTFTQSSGVPEFDEAVEFAWQTAGRFPNPPKDLLDSHNQLRISWTFTVSVGRQYLFRSLRPRRVQ